MQWTSTLRYHSERFGMEPEKWITLNIEMVDLANIIQWLYMYKGQLDSVLGMKTSILSVSSFNGSTNNHYSWCIFDCLH